MKTDSIEALQRHATVLLGQIEAAMLPEDRERLREIERDGGGLLLSVDRRGELSVCAVLDGRIVGVPLLITPRGTVVTMNLPRLTARDATAGEAS
ncbi:hypothetical protein [Paraburkholderia sp. BR13444]|uniref:hypothetical protein n=1 Tax=Paraburkholderia sp. BR13444 TaxID=3236997 RepID=UPI0034CD57D1